MYMVSLASDDGMHDDENEGGGGEHETQSFPFEWATYDVRFPSTRWCTQPPRRFGMRTEVGTCMFRDDCAVTATCGDRTVLLQSQITIDIPVMLFRLVLLPWARAPAAVGTGRWCLSTS